MQSFKNGLFNIHVPTNGEADEADSEVDVQTPTKTYEERGFEQAGNMRGSTDGLAICLNRIYQQFKAEVRDDHTEQEEGRNRLREKIQEHQGGINTLQTRVQAIEEGRLPTVRERISSIGERIRDIRQNPEQIVDEAVSKASFYIGTAILVCLSVYLFVFYSSASYSAFFKQFTPDELGIANSIFDAQALPKAYGDGITELILLLTMPFVFMGLGYLIHKFQQGNNQWRYLKVAALIFVTFVFDCILAYEITEKIYRLEALQAFSEVPEYTFSAAAQDPKFWLIIFAGFMVYIIWGFVFDFVVAEHEKLDRVSLAIRSKQEEAEDAKDEKQNLEEQALDLEREVAEHQAEIDGLQNQLDNTVFIPRRFERRTSAFMVGWISWMRANRHPDSTVTEAKQVNERFLQNVLPQSGEQMQFEEA